MRGVQRLSFVGMCVALAACGDSTGTSVTVDDLLGTWNVTKMEWSDPTGSAAAYDLIQNGGSFTITVAAGGTVSGSGTSPLSGAVTVSGTVAVKGDSLTLGVTLQTTGGGAAAVQLPSGYTFTLAGNLLTLTANPTLFDFGFNQTPDVAVLVMVFQRQ